MMLFCKRVQPTLLHSTRPIFQFSAEKANIFKLEKESDWKKLVLDSKHPVVVDFFATWCGPCKRLAPSLEKFALQYSGKLNLVMVDIDQHQNLAQQNSVEAVPTVKLFIHGKATDEFMGLPNEARIKELFDRAVKTP